MCAVCGVWSIVFLVVVVYVMECAVLCSGACVLGMCLRWWCSDVCVQ